MNESFDKNFSHKFNKNGEGIIRGTKISANKKIHMIKWNESIF